MSRLLDELTFASVPDGGGFEVAEVPTAGERLWVLRNPREGVGPKALRPGAQVGFYLAEMAFAFHADGWSFWTGPEWDDEWGAICEADVLTGALA